MSGTDDDNDFPDEAVISLFRAIGTGAAGLRAVSGAGHAKVSDQVSISPTVMGTDGRAWMVDLDAFRQFIGDRRNPADAAIVAWIVEAPYAHPCWHSYFIDLIHLRPLEARPAPLIRLPGATHEFWVSAMDPDCLREIIIQGQAIPLRLYPINFAAQIKASSDAEAAGIIEQTVQDIIDGRLNPDTDNMRQWLNKFGDHLLKSKYSTTSDV